jgi:GNAT superfamily N-acetyltransferase
LNPKLDAKIVTLGKERVPEAVAVLCDAFYDYPVMRFIIGEDDTYDQKLNQLVTMFVAARALRDSPVLGAVDSSGELIGIATVSLPTEVAAPPEFDRLRDGVWRRLGQAAQSRYHSYGETCMRFEPQEPHHHLNMLGVRRSHAGQGFARPLLEAVGELCRMDPASGGVSLSTELSDNVKLYEYFHYQVLGNAPVAGDLETWVLYWPRPSKER